VSWNRSLIPAATALVLLAASSTAAAKSVRAAAPPPPVADELAVLERSHDVFAAPDRAAARVARVARRRPITGVVTVLPILREATGTDGQQWLRVLLPGRPNGATGWIAARATKRESTPWRVHVRLATRRVTVYRQERVVRTFRGVVGAPSTPTPRGRFFVEESVRLGPARVGAPYALALSARSNVLEQFAGGPGQIALHGLGNVGGVPGSAASHGCVRLGDRAITWLAGRIAPGVRVTIVA
jgi:lipoprotein-anchoring transpeptidase ErfK/SrfK